MITGATLDHVAVAAERWEDAWPCYAQELGGRWVSGGEMPGFAAHQVRYDNGAKLEVIRPHAVEHNDFVRRFIDRNGLGPHHLTFKVPDIRVAIEEATTAGYPPVNIALDDPDWKEAFIHPKDAPGIVVQLAQSSQEEWSNPEPRHFPEPTHRRLARLDRVVHAVASLDEGLALFAGLLDGREVERGEGWVELAWDKPGRIRLVHGDDFRPWLGDRRGRVHHLAFTCPWLDGGPVEIEPEANLGTRLVMFPA